MYMQPLTKLCVCVCVTGDDKQGVHAVCDCSGARVAGRAGTHVLLCKGICVCVFVCILALSDICACVHETLQAVCMCVCVYLCVFAPKVARVAVGALLYMTGVCVCLCVCV